MPCEKIAADNPAVMKRVTIHEVKIFAIIFQFKSDNFLSRKLIPTTAPVIHCVDETGRPYLEQNEITRAVASSAENPLEGDIYVIFLPKTSMILIPYVERPTTIPNPPIARTHGGTSIFDATAPFS